MSRPDPGVMHRAAVPVDKFIYSLEIKREYASWWLTVPAAAAGRRWHDVRRATLLAWRMLPDIGRVDPRALGRSVFPQINPAPPVSTRTAATWSSWRGSSAGSGAGDDRQRRGPLRAARERGERRAKPDVDAVSRRPHALTETRRPSRARQAYASTRAIERQ